jgi:ABC-type sugar transport system ATPase subunit
VIRLTISSGLVEQFGARGVGFVVITHIVLHAFQVAVRIVVLRMGRITGERPVRSTSPKVIVSLITGELGDESSPTSPRRAPG